MKSDFKKALLELQTYGFSSREESFKTKSQAEIVWDLIFTIGINKVNFTEKEKKEFGPLIKKTLNRLSYCMSRIMDHYYDLGYSLTLLMLRSSVEFLLNDYRDFPIGNGETLEESLSEFEMYQSVDELTDIIETQKNCPLQNLLDYNDPPPKSIPPHHFWWFHEKTEQDYYWLLPESKKLK